MTALNEVKSSRSSTGQPVADPPARRTIRIVHVVERRTPRASLKAECPTSGTPGPLATVVKLDPARIRPSRWHSRDAVSFGDIGFQQLCADIHAEAGNTIPIKVRAVPPPTVGASNTSVRHEVVYGHRRHRACLVLGLQVTAIIDDVDEQGLVRAMVKENHLHNAPSALEQGRLYCQLLDEKLFPSLRRMAEFLRRDAGDVSRALALARLPAAILAAMTDPRALALHDASRFNAAMELGSDRAVRLAQDSLERSGKITPKALIRLLIDGPPKVPDATLGSPPTPIVLRGRTIGSVQVESPGKLIVNVQAPIPPARQEEIKRQVADYLQGLLS